MHIYKITQNKQRPLYREAASGLTINDVLNPENSSNQISDLKKIIWNAIDSILFVKQNFKDLKTFESAYEFVKSRSNEISKDAPADKILRFFVSLLNSPTNRPSPEIASKGNGDSLYSKMMEFENYIGRTRDESGENKRKQNRNADPKIVPDLNSLDLNNTNDVFQAIKHIGIFKEKSKSSFRGDNNESFTKAYLLGIAGGKKEFRENVALNNSFRVEDQDQQNAYSRADSIMTNSKVVAEIKSVLYKQKYGITLENTIDISMWLTFLICVFEGDVKNLERENGIQNLCGKYIGKLDSIFGNNWKGVADFSKFTNLSEKKRTDKPKGTLSEEQIVSEWKSGIEKGKSDISSNWSESQGFEFSSDINDAISKAETYLLERLEKVKKIFMSSDKFKLNNVTDFAQNALVILALNTAGISSKDGKYLKELLSSRFHILDISYRNWVQSGLFQEIVRLKTRGGYSSSFSSEQAGEIWNILRDETAKMIQSAIAQMNPKQSEKYREIVSKPNLLTDPKRLASVVGERILYPENIYMGKELVREAEKMVNATPNSIASVLLNSTVGWCGGKVDFSAFEYDRFDAAQKNTNQSGQPEQPIPEMNKNDNQPEKTPKQLAVYLSGAFLGTISVILALLFDLSHNRGQFMI